ncbi:MAG: RIP metalloprotease RseP [Alphaproteobacteria bacterium]|nr:RIP metalloprotease RseP [Alphaproteobacteria bacterium]
MPVVEFLLNWVIPFLVILTILVFVHEMGHYTVARMNGVRVETFSIGFGREIFGWNDRSGTRWKFSLIPLGGYVKMFGDANAASAGSEGLETMTPAERKVSFHHKSVGARSAIVFAGPFINYVFALLVLICLFMFYGQPFTPPKIGVVTPDGPAATAGLKPGDRIVAIDGQSVARFEEAIQLIRLNPEIKVVVSVERDGKRIDIPVTPTKHTVTDRHDNKHVIGRIGVTPFSAAVVDKVQAKSAAAAVGMRTGDRIVSVARTPVRSFEEMAQVIRDNPGRTVALGVIRDGRRITLRPTLARFEIKLRSGETMTIGRLGITRKRVEYVQHGFGTAAWQAVRETVAMTRATATAIGQMIEGKRSTKDLGGPLKIAEISGQMAQLGIREYIWFMAILSLHLCLINLFPVPMLDGGHLVFYAYEAVAGKPLGERAQEYGFRIGLALVLTLMLFVTWNDIVHLTDKIGLLK